MKEEISSLNKTIRQLKLEKITQQHPQYQKFLPHIPENQIKQEKVKQIEMPKPRSPVEDFAKGDVETSRKSEDQPN